VDPLPDFVEQIDGTEADASRGLRPARLAAGPPVEGRVAAGAVVEGRLAVVGGWVAGRLAARAA
jgi:hypothetical protein